MFRLQYANNFKHKTCFQKFVGTWNEKQQKLDLKNLGPKNIHITSRQNFPVAAALPIPENINASETTRFSPYRARDISATVLSQSVNVSNTHFDFTNSSLNLKSEGLDDKHVQSYDCFGAVSLNSAMQSNVPSPFGGMNKFSHLNMPGGQWSQDCKFMSQNLQDSHYTSLRRNARSNWTQYDPNAVINKKTEFWNAQSTRQFSNKNDKEQTPTELTKKEQLKKAFKEYGSTVIVFHIAISLISLEICYLLVSGGIDVMPILEYCGLASTALSNKIAVGASTFVIAYAIHKVFAPVRIGITLAVTPFIVRYLRKKGFLKPTSIK